MAIGSKISELSETISIQSNDYFPLVGTRSSVFANLKIKGSTIISLLSSDPNVAINLDTRVTELSAKYINNKIVTDGNVSGKVNRSGDSMTGFLTLSGTPVNDLHAATKKYVDDGLNTTESLPVGSTLYFAASAPPPKFLVADGSLKLKADYPELLAVLENGNLYGSTSTHFNLPNLIGKYPRGGVGFDATNGVGRQMSDIIKTHIINGVTNGDGTHVHPLNPDGESSIYHVLRGRNGDYDAQSGGGLPGFVVSENTRLTGSIGSGHVHAVNITYGDTTNNPETRPKSLILLPIIKYI